MTPKNWQFRTCKATQVLERLNHATLNGQEHLNTRGATRVPSRPLYSTAVARFRYNTPVEARSVVTPGDTVTIELSFVFGPH